jgi:LAO/AO transport system kinase
VPGLGDDVQAIKAGVLEVADILVVNKADREGASRLATTLRGMLSLAHTEGWRPPIVQTVAASGKGVPELLDEVAKHRAYLEGSGRRAERTRARLRAEVLDRAQELVTARLLAIMDSDSWFAGSMERMDHRELDPATVAADLAARLTG